MQPQGLGYKPPQAHGGVPPRAVAKVDGHLLEAGWLEKESHGDVGQVEVRRYRPSRGRRKGRVVVCCSLLRSPSGQSAASAASPCSSAADCYGGPCTPQFPSQDSVCACAGPGGSCSSLYTSLQQN